MRFAWPSPSSSSWAAGPPTPMSWRRSTSTTRCAPPLPRCSFSATSVVMTRAPSCSLALWAGLSECWVLANAASHSLQMVFETSTEVCNFSPPSQVAPVPVAPPVRAWDRDRSTVAGQTSYCTLERRIAYTDLASPGGPAEQPPPCLASLSAALHYAAPPLPFLPAARSPTSPTLLSLLIA